MFYVLLSFQFKQMYTKIQWAVKLSQLPFLYINIKIDSSSKQNGVDMR